MVWDVPEGGVHPGTCRQAMAFGQWKDRATELREEGLMVSMSNVEVTGQPERERLEKKLQVLGTKEL